MLAKNIFIIYRFLETNLINYCVLIAWNKEINHFVHKIVQKNALMRKNELNSGVNVFEKLFFCSFVYNDRDTLSLIK